MWLWASTELFSNDCSFQTYSIILLTWRFQWNWRDAEFCLATWIFWYEGNLEFFCLFLSGFFFRDTDDLHDSRGREETILRTTSTHSRIFKKIFFRFLHQKWLPTTRWDSSTFWELALDWKLNNFPSSLYELLNFTNLSHASGRIELTSTISLTHFSPMSHFYTPWKRQNVRKP